MVTTSYSVSHGTLRLADILPALIDELWRVGVSEEHAQFAFIASAKLAEPGFTPESEAGDDLYEALCARLDACAGPGLYFGTHWGDGSELGFWPEES